MSSNTAIALSSFRALTEDRDPNSWPNGIRYSTLKILSVLRVQTKDQESGFLGHLSCLAEWQVPW